MEQACGVTDFEEADELGGHFFENRRALIELDRRSGRSRQKNGRQEKWNRGNH
jgi:hypothetical protein